MREDSYSRTLRENLRSMAEHAIAAQEQRCVTEMLIIAAALEIQDPRDRPYERAEAADRAHDKFNDERSDFLVFVKLWAWFEEALKHKKSNRKQIGRAHV